MAPEQAQGKKDVGPAADVYALGAILYHCLTGRPPIQAANVPDMLHQVVYEFPTPLQQVVATPRELEQICLKCLNKSPAQRYAGAAELAEDLERFLQDRPVKARAESVLHRAWRLARPKLLRGMAFGVVAIGLAVGLFLALTAIWSGGRVRPGVVAEPAPAPAPRWVLVEPLPNKFIGRLAQELHPLRDIVLGLKSPVDAHTLGEIAEARKKNDYELPDIHYFTYALEPALRLEGPGPRLQWGKDLHVRVAVYLVALEGHKLNEEAPCVNGPERPAEMDVAGPSGTLCRIVAFVFPLDDAACTRLRQTGFPAKLLQRK
jgi:hypothetical protein